MTSLKFGKTRKKQQKWTPTCDGVRARPKAARGCGLVRRRGDQRLVAALEPESSNAMGHERLRAEDGHRAVVTVTDPKANSDEALGFADPTAAQLNRHRKRA